MKPTKKEALEMRQLLLAYIEQSRDPALYTDAENLAMARLISVVKLETEKHIDKQYKR